MINGSWSLPKALTSASFLAFFLDIDLAARSTCAIGAGDGSAAAEVAPLTRRSVALPLSFVGLDGTGVEFAVVGSGAT